MNGLEQQKSHQTRHSVAVTTLATNLDATTSAPSMTQTEVTSGEPIVMVIDQYGTLPQLIKIETVRSILAIENWAAYELVAAGSLKAPLKFRKTGRAAAKWLLPHYIDFIRSLKSTRSLNLSTQDVVNTISTGKSCLSHRLAQPAPETNISLGTSP